MKMLTENYASQTAEILNNNQLNNIKAKINKDGNSPAAMKAAAQQFEALFLSQILKSMRKSIPEDGIFNSQHTKMYTEMLDQEVSQQVAKQGIGLADQMLRHLVDTGQLDREATKPYLSKRQIAAPVSAYRSMPIQNAKERASSILNNMQAFNAKSKSDLGLGARPIGQARLPKMNTTSQSDSIPNNIKNFKNKLMYHAQKASRTTGIQPQFMIAQAALETGWGKKQINYPDGRPSYNLFGIKANHGWTGKTVDVMTSEFENGKMVKKVEKFRAYDSYADSFKDYANFLSQNPRYQNVMNAQDPMTFAYGLQHAGYATDPDYGSKLMSVINRLSRA